MSIDPPQDDKDIMRILIATDNHLGFMERDRIRRNDSFITVEEILSVAIEKNVDFLLFGGDLFNDNKPSRETLHRTIKMFRKYCCGDRPVPLCIQSDQNVNFRDNFGTVNYEHPDFNISLPVFAIHGNHDDPTGENGLSAMDLLSVSNLINYFGKSTSIDDIHVKPILITKGITKLALYGLGHIRDERLYQTFRQKKVKFYRPISSSGDDSNSSCETAEWFNLFVIHQNRNQHHTKKASISESMLRGFFDIVVWGHEHEQNIKPSKSAEGNFEVIQPGSSIVTGLIPEEAKPKKICMLEIYKDQYRFEEISLHTVRPFVMETITLRDFDELEKNNAEEIADFLSAKVEEMITRAEEKWKEQIKDVPENTASGKLLKDYGKLLKLPLIRLKVDYSGGYASVNPQRFGQRFVDRVANPADILLLTRSKQKSSKRSKGAAEDEEEDSPVTSKESILKALLESRSNGNNQEFLEAASNALTCGITIEDLVGQYLKQNELSLLNELHLQDAVESFVKKEEIYSINEFVANELKKRQTQLWKDTKKMLREDPSRAIDEDAITKLVKKYSEEERAIMELDHDQRRAVQATTKLAKRSSDDDETLTKKKKKGTQKNDDDDDEEMPSSPTRQTKNDGVEDEEDEDEDLKKKKSTRGRGRGRGAKATTTRGRGRGKKATATSSKKNQLKFKDPSDDDDNDYQEEVNQSDEEKPKRVTRNSTRTMMTKKTTGKRTRNEDDELDFVDKESSDEKEQPKKKKSKKEEYIFID